LPRETLINPMHFFILCDSLMQPIIVVPFASEIHGKEYYANVLEVFRKHFGRYGIDFHSGIITSFEEAESLGKKYQEFLPIALVLTGGTSNLVFRFATSGSIDKLFIMAHSEHNSLASAISARAKLEREGIVAGLYWCEEYYSLDCETAVDKVMSVARSVAQVVGSKVAIVADRDKGEVEETFESRFDATVDIIPLEQFASMMNVASGDKVREIVLEIEKSFEFEASKQALERVARMFLAFEELVKKGYNAISIDCFPFILKYGTTPCIPLSLLNSKGTVATCEADLQAALGMMLARALTKKSGWIGNAVSFKSNRAMLAHCTIALDLLKGKATAMQHFETSAPYAIVGEVESNVVTLVSIDRDFSVLFMERGRVVKSGLLTYGACRMQMVIEFDTPIEVVPRYAPANHHVVLVGDWIEELRDIAYMLNMDAVMYSELIV